MKRDVIWGAEVSIDAYLSQSSTEADVKDIRTFQGGPTLLNAESVVIRSTIYTLLSRQRCLAHHRFELTSRATIAHARQQTTRQL